MKPGSLARLAVPAAVIMTFGAVSLQAAEALPAAPGVGVSIIRMLGSLAIVIGILFGGAWLFRNGFRLKPGASASRKLNVLEARSLGPRQGVYVIGYEQQRLLIGATPQGMTLLAHLGEEPAAEAGAVTPTETRPLENRVLPFGQALLQALGRK